MESSKNIFEDLKPTELTKILYFSILRQFLCLTHNHESISMIEFSVTSDKT